MTTTKGFGKVDLTSNGTGGKKYLKELKPKEGTPVISFRLVPPVKSGVETGRFAEYINLHRGFQGVNKNDPSKPGYRSFVCIEERNFKTKKVYTRCPMCDLIEARKEDLKKLEANLRVQGVEEKSEEWKQRREPLVKWIKDFYIDRKVYLNAVEKDTREPVLLALTSTAFKTLRDRHLKPLSENGTDPFDVNAGVWFKLTRTGKALQTVDDIVVYKEYMPLPNGVIAEVNVSAALTQEEQERLLEEAADLASHGFRISAEQIAELTTCSGDPEEVDRILGISREGSPVAETPARWVPPTTLPQATAPAFVPPSAPAVVQTPAAAPLAPAVVAEDPQIALLKAQLAALQAAQNTAATPAAPAATPVAPAQAPVAAAPSDPSNVESQVNAFLSAFPK